MNIENIDSDIVVVNWLLKLNEWLIEHQSDKNQDKLRGFVYRIKQWGKVLQSGRNVSYLQTCLQSYNEDCDLIIDSFKRHFCIYTIVECSDVPMEGYDIIIFSLYYTKFIRLIHDKIESIPILCDDNHKLINTPEIDSFLTNVTRKANIDVSGSNVVYKSIQQHISSNAEKYEKYFCSIYRLCLKVEDMINEISLENKDKTVSNIRQTFAALTLDMVNKNMDATIRELEIIQNMNDRVYTKSDVHLTSEFISTSYFEFLNRNVDGLLPELKKEIQQENITKTVATLLLELPYYRNNLKGNDCCCLESSKLEAFFFSLYQPNEIQSLFNYKLLVNYESFNNMDMTISPEVRKSINEFEPSPECMSFVEQFNINKIRD